eukprot:gene4299-4551_t
MLCARAAVWDAVLPPWSSVLRGCQLLRHRPSMREHLLHHCVAPAAYRFAAAVGSSVTRLLGSAVRCAAVSAVGAEQPASTTSVPLWAVCRVDPPSAPQVPFAPAAGSVVPQDRRCVAASAAQVSALATCAARLAPLLVVAPAAAQVAASTINALQQGQSPVAAPSARVASPAVAASAVAVASPASMGNAAHLANGAVAIIGTIIGTMVAIGVAAVGVAAVGVAAGRDGERHGATGGTCWGLHLLKG